MRNRWTVSLVCLAALLLLGGSIAVDNYKSHSSIATAFTRLRLVHELRTTALRDVLTSLQTELEALRINTEVKTALAEFRSGWQEAGANAPQVLKRIYLKQATGAAGNASGMATATTQTYQRAHQSFDPWASQFLRHFGYYDVFLLDPAGNIIYTQAKESDFADNVLEGELARSNFAALIRKLVAKPHQIAFTDFARYSPSNDAPAAFAGVSVLDSTGDVSGYVVVQLPREPLEQVMLQSDGLGETGETYAVGPDKLMRNQSRFSKTSSLLVTKVKTKATRQGLSGKSGSGIIQDYRDVPVLSVWAPFSFGSVSWVLIAEIDEAEVRPTPWWQNLMQFANLGGHASAKADEKAATSPAHR